MFERTSANRKGSIFVDFNPKFHTTRVLLKQTALHATIINHITKEMTLNNMLVKGIGGYGHFELAEGLLEPDYHLQYLENNEPLIACEVGFSQPSKEVEGKIRAILNKTPTKVGVLFDIKESPKYKNPFIMGDNNQDGASKGLVQAAVNSFKSKYSKTDMKSALNLQNFQSPEGTLSAYGQSWMGEFTGFVQVYVKDPTTQRAVARTKRLLFYGKQETSNKQWKERLRRPIYTPTPDLNIMLSDFLPFENETYRRNLKFNWDELRYNIGSSRRMVAEKRILKAVQFLRNKGIDC
ncbi:hypothetical protein PRK78_007459 [Emydomyces testavorans]|uniref:Uncharacterized protein n=1 Tax=Emydomyces testavorans TaxID=2070801 RepID=A0AAF0DN93_9EURO|nr:hypothetical protein PRK78_007459 [Emydomyces testavorans]